MKKKIYKLTESQIQNIVKKTAAIVKENLENEITGYSREDLIKLLYDNLEDICQKLYDDTRENPGEFNDGFYGKDNEFYYAFDVPENPDMDKPSIWFDYEYNVTYYDDHDAFGEPWAIIKNGYIYDGWSEEYDIMDMQELKKAIKLIENDIEKGLEDACDAVKDAWAEEETYDSLRYYY